jgi:hypothetical protein
VPPWAAFLVLLGEVCASVGCLSQTTTTVGEARSLRCLTRLLLHKLLHLHDLVGTKLGGSAIITAYSLHSSYAWGLGFKDGRPNFQAFNYLATKTRRSLSSGGYSAAPLRMSIRSYNRLRVVGL